MPLLVTWIPCRFLRWQHCPNGIRTTTFSRPFQNLNTRLTALNAATCRAPCANDHYRSFETERDVGTRHAQYQVSQNQNQIYGTATSTGTEYYRYCGNKCLRWIINHWSPVTAGKRALEAAEQYPRGWPDGTAVRRRQVVIMSVSVHSGENFAFDLVLVSMSHGKFILVQLYIIKKYVYDRSKESRVA